jgi:hypothetical protein
MNHEVRTHVRSRQDVGDRALSVRLIVGDPVASRRLIDGVGEHTTDSLPDQPYQQRGAAIVRRTDPRSAAEHR